MFGVPHESGGECLSGSGSRPSAITLTARVAHAAVVGVPVLGPLRRVGREQYGKGGLVALPVAHMRGSKSRVWDCRPARWSRTADPVPRLPGE